MAFLRMLLIPSLCLAGACGGGTRAVRGDDVEGLDYHAMSTGLDKRDLQKALHENMQAMKNSAVVQRWSQENRPGVAALPMQNETSEHIDSALQALITDVETELINWGGVKVVSMQDQQQLLQEIRQQYSEGFDQTQISHWGKQVGARYFVTGKVFSTDERHEGERRVQYYLFIKVLDAETSELLFQYKTSVTKALVR